MYWFLTGTGLAAAEEDALPESQVAQRVDDGRDYDGADADEPEQASKLTLGGCRAADHRRRHRPGHSAPPTASGPAPGGEIDRGAQLFVSREHLAEW